MTGILVDTCAVIWIAMGERIARNARMALDASIGSPTYVSPVTAWELGLQAALGRQRFSQELDVWFASFLEKSGFRLAGLPVKILIGSSFLVGDPPKDPADRILIATARAYDFRIMTRDRKILSYAEQGHVQAIAC